MPVSEDDFDHLVKTSVVSAGKDALNMPGLPIDNFSDEQIERILEIINDSNHPWMIEHEKWIDAGTRGINEEIRARAERSRAENAVNLSALGAIALFLFSISFGLFGIFLIAKFAIN